METGKGRGRSQSYAAVKYEPENSRSELEEAAKLPTPLIERANTTGSLGPEGPTELKEALAVTKQVLKGYTASLQNVLMR